ncbi:septation ring formation regulator EzrA [Evansella sp. AB-P1]|uniref:septation ring formation regulator EzrA n=1 Tax=Evansella sp. AB-P1 TaxID=3037653 RepID=UPI00241C9180|nr:septation ring formation regulator EzrA [Evansella sp. AB-P1]MDG5787015.1 septation ring formation regulator EzrA [Evansella sp. AB-P1]
MYMYIIYGLILLIAVVVFYGAWSRKKIYKEVDRLEHEKIQLLNEPVTDELSRIKSLKMLGETEERFDQWRNSWDEIVTIQLPDIEEKLFDIEELANKYRFNKCKRLIKFVDEEFSNIKEHLQEMLEEIDQLVHSEEQNRQDIHEVKNFYHEVKKLLWAHRGTLGGTGITLDKQMKEVQELFNTFEIKTEEGNYLQARETLLQARNQLESLNELIQQVPQFLVQIEKEIPRQIEDLEKGLSELEEEGYSLEHFTFKFQIKDMKRRLFAILPLVENLKLEEVGEPIEIIQKEIDEIYEKLEYEVISKQIVLKEIPEIQERLGNLPFQFKKLRDDTETVKLSYRLSEEDDRKQLKMEKKLKDLSNQFSVILDAIEENKQTYTALRGIIQDFKASIEELEKEMQDVNDRLNHLRKDERTAAETISELRNKLIFGHKKLKKSNLPGVPESLLIELDEAEKNIYQASDKLNEIPLSMDEVLAKVDDATHHVERCVEKLLTILEEAALAESVIQYGNRYRRQYDNINISLLQAEDYFRNYQYKDALEIAVQAIEPVDPDVLEKVSVLTSAHH